MTPALRAAEAAQIEFTLHRQGVKVIGIDAYTLDRPFASMVADSTGAVVGGIAGATVGAGGIPGEWLDGLLEWPRSVAWMRVLASRLALQFPTKRGPIGQGPLRLCWSGLLPRNLAFLLVVLLHGFRRLLPPYG